MAATPFDPTNATFTLSNGQSMSASQYAQLYPGLYAKYVQNYAQPGADLQQTQTSTANTQAAIPGTQANSAQQQLQLQKNTYLNSSAKQFDSAKNKQGYVDPALYNSIKDKSSGLISSSDFDSTFNKFTDPTQQWKYNTDSGRALQVQRGILTQKLSDQVNQALKQYDSLQHTGPLEAKAASNPLYQYLGFGGGQKSYENNRQTIAQTLLESTKGVDLAALGLNTTDIAKIAANLPSVNDNTGAVQSKLQQLSQSPIGSYLDSDVLKKAGVKQDLGVGDVAHGGGDILKSILGSIVNPVINAVNQTSSDEAKNQQTMGNTKGDLGKSALLSLENTGNFAKNTIGNPSFDLDAAQLAGLKGLGKIIPGIGGVAESAATAGGKSAIATDILKSIIPGLSGGKKAAGEAIGKAAAEGGNVDWEKIASAAQDKAANLGTRVQKELGQLLIDEKPTPQNSGEIENPVLSSPQALELRQGLGQRLPSGYFPKELQKVFGKGGSSVPRNKAIGILRDAVSQELKKSAPNIKNPDALYSFYSKIHGDAPAWGKRILAGAAIDQVSQKLPAPLRGISDALPFLFGLR